MIIFMQANGLSFEASNDDLTSLVLTSLNQGSFQKDRLETWLRNHSA
ncbi:MAG: hypothetical protein AAFR69_01185 [Pseudomonadota bacterium]